MEEKTFRNVIFHLLFFLMSFRIFTAQMATAQRIPNSIKVGVVLDMNDYFGQIGLNCMSMALPDIYAAHVRYKTRLVLIDSPRATMSGQIQQASLMIALGNKAQVPITTFWVTSHSLSSLHSSYFIQATLNYSSQAHAKSAIIQAYGWREIVPIYEDNEFGEGIIPFLTDTLEQVEARVLYRSVISPLATDDQITAELYKFMTIHRVFLIHVVTSLGSRLVIMSKQLGMVSVDYVSTVTDGIYKSNSTNLFVIESMLGKRNPGSREARSSRNSTGLEAVVVSRAGQNLIHAVSTTTFRGLARKFQLVDDELQSPLYQIINLDGPGARVVGYWTKENGLVKDLNSAGEKIKVYSTSKSDSGSTIWPGDNISLAKGWVIQTNWKKLRIGVPVNDGFTEFVSVTWDSENSTKVEGLCIDVFEAVMKALPYDVPYEYIPFATSDHKMAGTYNDLTSQVYTENYDAVIGDVTIVGNRSLYVDFTVSYMESFIIMVVPYNGDNRKDAWISEKPINWELWLTSFSLIVSIGLIWILEHRINEDFRGTPLSQGGMIFWFVFSTTVFDYMERVMRNLPRFVLSICFLVVLILIRSYTASLPSMLTVHRLNPTVTNVNELISNKEYVGYKTGSFVYEFLKEMEFDESKLVAFNSPAQLDELFSKGSGNGGISAAFDEIPYIKVFLEKYCSKYTTIGPAYRTGGFGFVFPKRSPLEYDVSRAILDVTESGMMMEIKRRWLGDETKCLHSPNLLPKVVYLKSSRGLFLTIGLSIGTTTVIMFVISFLRARRKVVKQTVTPATIWNNTVRRFWIFEDGEPNSPTLKNRGMNDRDQQSPISLASPGNDLLPCTIFRSPSEHNENIQNDQGTPGNVRKYSQEEPSQMEIEIEIEIA